MEQVLLDRINDIVNAPAIGCGVVVGGHTAINELMSL